MFSINTIDEENVITVCACAEREEAFWFAYGAAGFDDVIMALDSDRKILRQNMFGNEKDGGLIFHENPQ